MNKADGFADLVIDGRVSEVFPRVAYQLALPQPGLEEQLLLENSSDTKHALGEVKLIQSVNL
jgi:hypothetical protein